MEEPREETGRARLVVGALVVVVALGIAWKTFGGLSWDSSTSADAATGDRAAESQAPAVLEHQVDGRRALERFRDSCDDVLEDLDKLKGAVDEWGSDVLSLREGPRGRRVASDPASVATMAELLERKVPSARDVAADKRTVRDLRTWVGEQLDQSGPLGTLSSTTQAELDDVAARVSATLPQLLADLEAVRGIVASATARGVTAEKGLAQTIADNRAAEAATQAATERRRQEEQAAAELAAEEEAHRLKVRAESSEVKKLYSAFLSKGHYECKNGTRLGGPPKPVSLENLKWWGVQTDVELFAAFACVRDVPYNRQGIAGKPSGLAILAFSGNDRPGAGDFPSTEEEWDLWEERRKEFNELVPNFLELGMLRP